MVLRVRIPAAERTLGVRLADIDEAVLRRLVDEGVEETDHLDFKSGFTADTDELAKECARSQMRTAA